MATKAKQKMKTSKNPSVLKRKRQVPISKTENLPATVGMINLLEFKIKSDFKSLEKKMDARFNRVDAQFNTIESGLANVASEVRRMAILMEEQNTRNKFVLDGYEQLYKRQDRLEQMTERRLVDMEEVLSQKKVSR